MHLFSLTLHTNDSATSAPRGPVYLWARREVLEEEVDESVMNAQVDVTKWPPIAPSGLSPGGECSFESRNRRKH